MLLQKQILTLLLFRTPNEGGWQALPTSMATLFPQSSTNRSFYPRPWSTNTLPLEIHAETDQENLRKAGRCKLVDMAEDTKHADFADDNDDQKSQKSQMVKPNSG